jgi:hypothetical protein
MKYTRSKSSLLSGLCSALTLVVGCSGPGTSNNDQGIAVTFLGYFSQFAAGCVAVNPLGLSGATLPLSTAKPEPLATISDANRVGLDSASNFVAVVGVQNNLFSQFFRADRLVLEYFIAGASIQPPTTNIPLNFIAGPGTVQPGAGAVQPGGVLDPTNGGRNPNGSSLPPAFQGQCNRTFGQTIIVPAAIREWMNFNRDALPEPPFVLEVTGKISGLSSSGNRITTQPMSLPVSVVAEIFVEPTEGTGDGATGGFEGDDDGTSVDPLEGAIPEVDNAATGFEITEQPSGEL